MKKTIAVLLFAVTLASGWVSAQRHDYMTEGFLSEAPYLTEGLWDKAEQSGMSALYMVRSTEAGGTAPEALWGYDPELGLKDVMNGTYRMTTRSFVMRSGCENYMALKYSYAASKVSAENARVFGLAARQGKGDWTVIKQLNQLKTVEGGVLVGVLPESLRGVPNVQFSLFYKTPDDKITYTLYFDDITCFAIEDGHYAVDYAWAGRPYTENGKLNVDLQVENTGNVMEACVVSYTFDGGDEQKLPLTFGAGLCPGERYQIAKFVPEGWDVAAYGKHKVELWLSEVNGEAVAEDKIVKQTKYLTNLNPETAETYPYRPLVEQFSSSTCGPCASYNRELNPELAKLSDTLTLIKYQMNWPGNGDPYYTEEGGVRRDYYGVNSVPAFVVDGAPLTLSNSVSTILKGMLAKAGEKTYYSMVLEEASVDVDQQIHVKIKVKAVGGMENVRLHTVVMERTTYDNVASNGETEFHNVMLKMLPDAAGTLVNLTADTTYTFEYVYDMTQTHMEEFSDLRVACFLQTASGEVLQSTAANVGSSSKEPGVAVGVDYMPAFICAENVPAGLKVIGTGGSEVTSVEITGKVGQTGTPVVQNYTLALNWGESTYVAFDGLKAPMTAGSDTVYFQVTKVNGEPFDGSVVRRPIAVQPTDHAFKPLAEGFTSAKDKGSVELNKYLASWIDAGGVCVIKFPMTGDKYTRSVYTRYAAKTGVKNAPGLAMNGYPVAVKTNGTLEAKTYFENLLEQVRKSNGIMAITTDGEIKIGENGTPGVVGKFNFESPVDGAYKLYMFVVESETRLNVGTNGETQFTRVVQALFPDDNGTSLKISNGKGLFVLSRTITASKVENYNNLSLVMVVKDADGREVLQTAEFKIENKGMANEDGILYETLPVYPNPASENVYLHGLDNATLEVFDLNGRKVFGRTGISGDYTLDVQAYEPGVYVVKVSEDAKVSTARVTVVR